jgi:DNA-binding CsgD family transcriptional regulator
MPYHILETELDKLQERLSKNGKLTSTCIKKDIFLEIINSSKYLITIHDIEFYKPICLNDAMAEFYGFSSNRLSGMDYVYYLKTIHTSTYHTLIDSIAFFKLDKQPYLNLEYKLLYQDQEWKNVIGSTKTILRNAKGKPCYALTLAKIFDGETKSSLVERVKTLTKREKEIISLLTAGYSKKEIGNKLFIATYTVETHTRSIYKKLEINKVSELGSIAETFNI